MNELKKKFAVKVSIAILLIVFFLYIGAEFLVKGIEASSQKIVEGKQTIALINNKNSRLAESKKQYEVTQKEMNEVLGTILGKDETVRFVEEAENIARENKVKLKIKPLDAKTEEAAQDFISSSSFSFTVGGGFDGVMHFLGAMENFKYCVNVENIKITFGDFDAYNKDMIILTFNVKLYQKDSQK